MDPQTAHDAFFHVRVLIGIVTGLAVTRLLTGLARFVQSPSRVDPVHLGWVFFLLLGVMHFWWFEFDLGRVARWTFQYYFFVVSYAALFFFTCAILFPDHMEEASYAEYFHARQAWFYGLLAAIFLVDMADTALKGAEHFRSFGPLYPVRQVGFAALAVVAIFVRDRRFHVGFVALALVAEVWWILRQFDVLA
jgi:hypothetical protein